MIQSLLQKQKPPCKAALLESAGLNNPLTVFSIAHFLWRMTMTSAITPYQGGQIIRTMDDAERAALAMAKSGYFQDSKDASQAVVKILAGQELGFGPFAAMTGVHIIQGRPSTGANLMAAAVKGSGKYNYRVTENTEKVCSIEFFERWDGKWQSIGISTFTSEDARKAGTKNMDKFPRNMLFARAMSNGVRWYCPDVFNGNPVYTPEELGANINEDGDVIDVPSYTPTPAAQPAAPVAVTERSEPTTPAPATNGNGSGKPSKAMIDKVKALVEQAEEFHLVIEQVDYSTISAADLAEYGKALKERVAQAEAAVFGEPA